MEHVTLLLSVALLLITTLFIYKYGAKRRRYVSMVNAVPGRPTLPILGNAMDITIDRKLVMAMVDKRAREYAPIFRTWGGPLAHVHLTKPEYAEIILGGMRHLEKSLLYVFLHPWLGQGLLTSSGSKWHSHRKLITPTFHFKIFETFCDVFVEKSQILVNKLQVALTSSNGEGFDLYPYITRCTLDIICETAMGTKIDVQEKTDSEYLKAVYSISEITLLRANRPWLHSDLVFNLTSMGKKYNHCLRVLHGFTEQVIRERKGQRMKEECSVQDEKNVLDFGIKKRQAFLDLLLEASQENSQLTDREIREEVDTFMFEGHDTTTAGVSWALFLLGANPHIQEKVIAELDEIFQNSDRPITMRDLQEMKYLERVIKETLRLYPSVPFIMRTLEGDTQCGNYLLPDSCMINIHIYHIHRDPDYFPEPEVFNPDHFLPQRVQGRHPYAYIPFSAGPRNCIGQKFAMLEEKTIIASLLRKFRLQAVEKREDLILIQELILRSESGIKIVLTPR